MVVTIYTHGATYQFHDVSNFKETWQAISCDYISQSTKKINHALFFKDNICGVSRTK